ncbi:hypothetical protein VDG1235_2958 [Verrucomicrobiia bacterium DG1235]|nr:hypothetical protein VDG1235_2958 [Verrucomicrobiae bacterium DG1235]
MHPDVADWRIGLAKTLLNSGGYEEAIEVMEEIKKMPPRG